MRLFFALWPPPEAARALAGWADELQQKTGGRAITAEGIHLTLAFLGEAKPERAIAGARRVNGALFQLPIEQAQYWRHNQIVWAGPRETQPVLDRLAADLQMQLFREEFILERKPFVAHVTLLRKVSPPERFPKLPRVVWPIDEFTLVRSVPGDAGSRYEIIERFSLNEFLSMQM